VTFIVIVNGSCSVCIFLYRLIFFIISNNLDLMYRPSSGFLGCSIALLIAFKQLYPEKEWACYNIYVKAKHLPLICLTFTFTLSLILFDGANFEFGFLGFVIGWLYLRYFQWHDWAVGDMSDAFRFTTLFPYQLLIFCTSTKPTTLDDAVGSHNVLDLPVDGEQRKLN